VVTDAESLQLRGGEGLSCNGDDEVLVGAGVRVRGGKGIGAHGVEVGDGAVEAGDWI
jgi:hypothetical protein